MTTRQSLYSPAILALATALPPMRLDPTDPLVAERHAPTCGSIVRARVSVNARGRIVTLDLDLAACALGQASAAVLAAHAHGLDRPALIAARTRMTALLAGEPAAALAAWPELDALTPARDHPGRHGSILLPYDAVIDALERAAARQAA